MLRALSRRATMQEFSLDTVAMVTIGFVSTFSDELVKSPTLGN